MNEATARIKINKLLEAAGWRFFADEHGPANIRLEAAATLPVDALGDDFENAPQGKIDFLLLNEKGFPLLVLEAKATKHEPLVGKEQARKYAKSQNCRFVILSNGNLHYFWDLERGDPYQITAFPHPASVQGFSKVHPNPTRLVAEPVASDYIALTQRANYASEAAWKNEAERPITPPLAFHAEGAACDEGCWGTLLTPGGFFVLPLDWPYSWDRPADSTRRTCDRRRGLWPFSPTRQEPPMGKGNKTPKKEVKKPKQDKKNPKPAKK